APGDVENAGDAGEHPRLDREAGVIAEPVSERRNEGRVRLVAGSLGLLPPSGCLVHMLPASSYAFDELVQGLLDLVPPDSQYPALRLCCIDARHDLFVGGADGRRQGGVLRRDLTVLPVELVQLFPGPAQLGPGPFEL